MISSFQLVEHNGHLLFDNGYGFILIDTGSPISFHRDRIIWLGEDSYPVSASSMGVTYSYLTENVGFEISGLLGMDIISKVPTLINTAEFGGFVMFGEVFPYPDPLWSFSVMGCIGIEMVVDGNRVRMLVDSGAPLSYINEVYTRGASPAGLAEDFSPLSGGGRFSVQTYEMTCYCGVRYTGFVTRFAVPPTEVSMLLQMCGADGIIGYDLFKNFRLVIQNGCIALPPQGI